MSVITFVNNLEEETGKTMSLVAIATHMAINNNNRILIISTTNKEDKINSCFFEEQQAKKMRLGIAKIARSNKLTPELITNYTKVVFKDRLEIILGADKNKRPQTEDDEKEIAEEYINLISVARMYYDKVFVDLDSNLSEEIRQRIVDSSDLVIVNTSQNFNSLRKLKEKKENSELLQSPKTLILVGRYDKFSKYNVKNISRFLEERNQILTIPYNTLYFEAASEAGVPDLFLRFKKISDSDDRNALFASEVKRAAENIIYRLQELQARL